MFSGVQCDASRAGFIRFNAAMRTFEGCAGVGDWTPLHESPETPMPRGNVAPSAVDAGVDGFNSFTWAGMIDGQTGCCGNYKAYFPKSKMPSRLWVDFGVGYKYTCSRMRWFAINTNASPKAWKVQYSNDKTNWQLASLTSFTDSAISIQNNRAEANNGDQWHGVTFTPAKARYWAALFVDVYNNGNNNAGMSEIEWYCS